MPGTDVRESTRMIVGELPEAPFLPELPARGPGADMIGRGAGLLAGLHVELHPSGWRFADRPGRDSHRAAAWLREDLDTLEEFTQEYAGPLKVAATGPWTLASAVELRHGEKALADPGACRDIAASLAEGLADYAADVKHRVPGADVILQLDEPSLPAILAGTVRTASGFGRLRSVEATDAERTIADVVTAVGVPVAVHCCAPAAPITLFRKAGAAAVSIDLATLRKSDDEALAESIEADVELMLGVVPAVDPPRSPSVKQLTERVLALTRIGFSAQRLAEVVTVTPSCGLAGASPSWARSALTLTTKVAQALTEAE